MSPDTVMLEMIAHGRAAMQKAKEIRAEQIAERTKLAEAAPDIVDALIANKFLSPEYRDITVQRMQKKGFAVDLFKSIATKAVPRNLQRFTLGTSDKTASSTQSTDTADAAWRSMLS